VKQMKIWVTGETDLIGHAIFTGKNTLVDISSAACCICAGDADKVATKALEIRKTYPDKVIILVIPGRVPVNVLRLAKMENFKICSPGKILDELPEEPEETPEITFYPVNHSSNNLPVPVRKKGKVVASFSTSGEVGKTFNATNIGTLSAKDKKKTILLEFDLGKGNALDALYIKPEGEYPDVLNWREFGEHWYTKVLRSDTGLYLLPRSPDTLEMLMSMREAMELIEEARNHFDLVIVDMDRNPFEEHAKAALLLADKVFLVTKVDQKGMTHARAFLTNAAKVLNLNDKIYLIANMVNQFVKYSPAKVAQELGVSEHGQIPFDSKVEDAKKKGKPLVVYGKGPAYQAIKEIYEKVLGEKGTAASKPSLLQRFFALIIPARFQKGV